MHEKKKGILMDYQEMENTTYNNIIPVIILIIYTVLVIIGTIHFNTQSIKEGNPILNKYTQGTHYNDTKWDYTEKIDMGTSMNPTIWAGNNLLIKKYTPDQNDLIQEGSILIYNNKGTRAVHRVIAKYKDELYMAGDNTANYESISYNQLEGIVVGVIYK